MEIVEIKSKYNRQVFRLNTLDMNTTESSRKLFGYLRAMIIKTNKKCKIEVYFGDNMIYSNLEFDGQKYIIPKTDVFGTDGEIYNYAQEYWLLDDTVTFRVSGNKETVVDFEVRMEYV